MKSLFFVAIFLIAQAGTPKNCLAANGKVVVSIAPLHAVVSAVMTGAGAPELLLKPSVSVHDYKLKPSDMRRLESADVVFYAGKELETFLPRALETLNKKNAIAFLREEGIRKLPARPGGLFKDEEENITKLHSQNELETDGHFWLDPDNMARAAEIAAEKLGALFPENKETYKKNAASFAAKIKTVRSEIRQALAPHAKKPYLVFHDAYQYFEKAFGLTPLATVTPDAHHAFLSAKRIAVLRRTIARRAPVCLFFEPQQNLKSVAAIKENLAVYDGTLDPLGTDLQTGNDFYFNLIHKLKDDLIDCLKKLPAEEG